MSLVAFSSGMAPTENSLGRLVGKINWRINEAASRDWENARWANSRGRRKRTSQAESSCNSAGAFEYGTFERLKFLKSAGLGLYGNCFTLATAHQHTSRYTMSWRFRVGFASTSYVQQHSSINWPYIGFRRWLDQV